MSVPTPTSVEVLEREWWARLPRLFYAPAGVFAELRDESREAADARQEPLVGDRLPGRDRHVPVARRARAAVRALPRAERAHADRRVDHRRRTRRRSPTSGSAAHSSTSARAGWARRPATAWPGTSSAWRRSRSSSCSSSSGRFASGSTASTCSGPAGATAAPAATSFIALDALALAWTLALVVIGIRADAALVVEPGGGGPRGRRAVRDPVRNARLRRHAVVDAQILKL